MSAAQDTLFAEDADRRSSGFAPAHGSAFRCIVADPPWQLTMRGKRKRAKEPNLPDSLPYPTMTLDEICALPVGELAAEDCHLWLWTTN